MRPHLDYKDIIYEQTHNDSSHQKMELVQCKTAPAITGTRRGTSRKNPDQELGLE